MLTLIYLIAITAEAMTGALAAGRRNMDIFGVAVIAFLTALGGGTVRDIVLGRFPIGWTQHPEYIYLVLGAGLIAIPLARHIQRLTPLFLFLDALGLVAFTVIGCDVALGMGYATPVVVMAGMITGIAGGVMRDVLCNRVPVVFRQELYASVSLVVAFAFILMVKLGVPQEVGIFTSFFVGVVLRMVALRWQLGLPVFSWQGAQH
ncbi:trimeric intracellular cation channel family protein [Crenobacter intestini]|uniref:Trimeric intracellular cation channel family protein n=1 Tax=Crenobacter intestini TaxID=2563443 RepID=A0A4V4N9D8_9NEIS|nr:trimeric intracellular cation channel family protein [Crenobacter intestini]TIC86893.1 trimeric intracellular cation channel family protein [Crenobacter intestini]